MRNLIVSVLFAVAVWGCGALGLREQVLLPTDDRDIPSLGGGGVLINIVIDVVADPKTGTLNISTPDGPMTWPKSFTAWRVGSEVEVLDGTGKQVLITGRRYMFHTVTVLGPWKISDARVCADCPLGAHEE